MSDLAIGDTAPNFELPVSEDKTLKLSNLKGKNVILYFYPKDDTPGCTLEAKAFNDLKAEFHKLNTVIIGISSDTLKSHNKFKTKYCLEFDLASDDSANVCKQYGVYGEQSLFGVKYNGISRTSFLIDKFGKIAHIWPKVSVNGHADEVLNEVTKLS